MRRRKGACLRGRPFAERAPARGVGGADGHRASVEVSQSGAGSLQRLFANMGPDVFLDAEVQGLLLLVLRLLRRRKLLCATQKDLDLRSWPGLLPFSDFFPRLLEQFAGESYGDAVFVCWLLVPLQAECDSHFRRLLFAEHPEALPLIRLLPSQSVVPLGRFLEPAEEDPVVLEAYASHLLSGKLTPDKTPMLFEMATHGVASFVRSKADSPLAIRLLSLLQHNKHHEAVQKVLNWERSTERPS